MAKNRVLYEGALTSDTARTINENFTDYAVCSTQIDATTSTTLANIPGMTTGTLEPGVYEFNIQLGTVSTANCGIKIGLVQNTASMISQIEYEGTSFSSSGSGSSRGTTTTSGTTVFSTAAVALIVTVRGTLTVTAAGTLTLQMAQNTSHADTASVFVGSYMKLNRIKAQ
jgi:hypothetical protein